MSRLHSRLRREALAQEHAALVAKALRDTPSAERAVVMGTGADPQRLRGIPAIGRCVSGCIRGTDPEREALR